MTTSTQLAAYCVTVEAIETEEEEVSRELTVAILDNLDGTVKSESFVGQGRSEVRICKYGTLTATHTGRKVHCRSVAFLITRRQSQFGGREPGEM